MISISYLFEFLGMSEQEQVNRMKSEQDRFKKESKYKSEYDKSSRSIGNILSSFDKTRNRQATLKRPS